MSSLLERLILKREELTNKLIKIDKRIIRLGGKSVFPENLGNHDDSNDNSPLLK